jgi:hypothetical protein
MFKVGLAAVMLMVMVFIMTDARADWAVAMNGTQQNTITSLVMPAARDQLFAAFVTERQNGQQLAPPAFTPVAVCNTAGCGATFTDTAAYACQLSTTSTSGTQITSANVNARVAETPVSCTITATLLVSGTAISKRVATQLFRTSDQQPYVEMVGNLDYSGSATAQTPGDGGGCDSTRPTSCDPNVTAAVSDTIIRSQNTCTYDATECSYGQAPPGDSYSNQSWLTTTASSNGSSR